MAECPNRWNQIDLKINLRIVLSFGVAPDLRIQLWVISFIRLCFMPRPSSTRLRSQIGEYVCFCKNFSKGEKKYCLTVLGGYTFFEVASEPQSPLKRGRNSYPVWLLRSISEKRRWTIKVTPPTGGSLLSK